MGDNITVCVRVRPLNRDKETDARCVRSQDDRVIISGPNESRAFEFHCVAGEEASQEHVFARVAMTTVESCLRGYNGTIFAYGQTGSGKTYTMFGDLEGNEVTTSGGLAPGCGVVPRALCYLFGVITQETGWTYSTSCSVLEIYNEKVMDLITDEGGAQDLQLRENPHSGVFVDGLREVPVSSWQQAYSVIKRAATHRKTSCTQMNDRSSRSHCVITIKVVAKKRDESGLATTRRSCLNLVDLAGSERQASTAATGMRLKEAGNINKSLTFLSSVIRNLVRRASGQKVHVQFRDTKLTYLLKDSLGGNSKTTFIATVSPSQTNYSESLSTLLFVANAKLIKNEAVINEVYGGNSEALNAQISVLMEENRRLKEAVDSASQMQVIPVQPQDMPCESIESELEVAIDTDKIQLESMLIKSIERKEELEEEANTLRKRIRDLEAMDKKRDRALQSLRLILKLREQALQRSSPLQSLSFEINRLKQENAELVSKLYDSYEMPKILSENYYLKSVVQRFEGKIPAVTDKEGYDMKLEQLVADLDEARRAQEKLMIEKHILCDALHAPDASGTPIAVPQAFEATEHAALLSVYKSKCKELEEAKKQIEKLREEASRGLADPRLQATRTPRAALPAVPMFSPHLSSTPRDVEMCSSPIKEKMPHETEVEKQKLKITELLNSVSFLEGSLEKERRARQELEQRVAEFERDEIDKETKMNDYGARMLDYQGKLQAALEERNALKRELLEFRLKADTAAAEKRTSVEMHDDKQPCELPPES